MSFNTKSSSQLANIVVPPENKWIFDSAIEVALYQPVKKGVPRLKADRLSNCAAEIKSGLFFLNLQNIPLSHAGTITEGDYLSTDKRVDYFF